MKERLSWSLQVVIVGVISSTVALWPYLCEFGRLVPGDSGDTLLNLWFFEHNLATIPLSASNLFPGQAWFSPDFYFPVAGVRGWSDHLFLPTMSYAFFKFLGFRPVPAFFGLS
jgi:hypothetical protein